MTYEESVQYLSAWDGNSPLRGRPAPRNSISKNITVLCERLGQPQREFQSVHVAGTNGKGSTSAMIDSILRAAGLRTGLYTSPHLERINERIRLDGKEISDAEFAATFTRLREAIEELLAAGRLAAHPTFFECVTAIAFDVFRRRGRGVCRVRRSAWAGASMRPTFCCRKSPSSRRSISTTKIISATRSRKSRGEKAGIIKPGARVVSAAEHLIARVVIRRRVRGAIRVPRGNRKRLSPGGRRRARRLLLVHRDFLRLRRRAFPSLCGSPAGFRFATRSRRSPPRGCWPSAARPSTTKPSRAASPRRAGPGASKRISRAPGNLRRRHAQSRRRARNRRLLGAIPARPEYFSDLRSHARQGRR